MKSTRHPTRRYRRVRYVDVETNRASAFDDRPAPAPWTSVALPSLVLLAALAFGAVHEPSSAVLEIGIWLFGAGWYTVRARSRIDRTVLAAGLALVSYLLVQQAPLPPSIVAAVSPATAEVRRETIDRIAAAPSERPPIASVAELEDAKVSPATRARIRELTHAALGRAPEGWYPVALHPFVARADLLRYLAYGVALWISATVTAPLAALRATVLAGSAIAALGLVEFVGWNGRILWFFEPYDVPFGATFDRMLGPFVNPDHFGAFLAMLLAPAAALFMISAPTSKAGSKADFARSLSSLPAVVFGLAVLVAGILGSGSRSSMTGAVFGAATFWIVLRRGRDVVGEHEPIGGAFSRLAPYAVLVLVVGGALLYVGPKGRSALDVRLGETIAIPDVEFRRLMAIETLPMIRDFPWFGVGAGSWPDLFLHYAHYPFVGFDPNHAHDDYIEWIAEVGGVGTLLTGLLVWAHARWLLRNQTIPTIFAAGLLGGVAAIGWQEIFDFALRVPANALLLALLLGLLANPNWVERPTPSPRPGPSSTSIVFVAAVLLTWASVRQIRESAEWASVVAGDAELSIAPRNAETWTALASVLYQSGFRYRPPTDECLRAAIRLRPASRQAFWLLSFVAATDEVRRASLEAALYLDPLRAAWRLRYAKLLEATGHPEEAIAQLSEAVYRDPRLSSHPFLDPSARAPSPSVRDAARKGLARALEERPNDPKLLAESASLHERFDEWNDAAELWLRASALDREPEPLVRNAAVAYAKAGRYANAETLLTRAIAAEPSSTEDYRTLALLVYRPQRKYEEAAKILEAGARSVPDAAPLYRALYDVRREQGDPRAAIEALEKNAALRGRDASTQYELAMAYFGSEDFHRANVALDRAIAADPRNAAYVYQKGVAAERLYDLGGALDSYRKAAAMEPANRSYSENLERVKNLVSESSKP